MNHITTSIKESWAKEPLTTIFAVSGLAEIALAWPVGMISLQHGMYTLMCGGICLFVGITAHEGTENEESEEDSGGGLEPVREQGQDADKVAIH